MKKLLFFTMIIFSIFTNTTKIQAEETKAANEKSTEPVVQQNVTAAEMIVYEGRKNILSNETIKDGFIAENGGISLYTKGEKIAETRLNP